jgi:hypothetical protein
MKSFLLVLLLLNTINAQWVSDSTINNPICTAADYQRNPQLTTDGNGGAIIVWEDRRTFSNQQDLYAQLINSEGYIQWTNDGIIVSTETDDQVTPQIISDGNGGAIIVWQDNRSGNANIYTQRINNNGSAQWTANGIPVCTAANQQFEPKLISDGNNGAIIVWKDYRSGFGYDIYAQRVDANGSMLWQSDGVVICSAVNEQSAQQIISDGADGAIIVWQDKRASDFDLYAQRIDENGNPLWIIDGVELCDEGNNQSSPVMISDGAGGAIIVWHDVRNGTDMDIFAQRINSNGNKLWIAEGVSICEETGNQTAPQITNDGNDGAVMVWTDYRSGDANLYSQSVNPSGNVLWTLDGIEICTANYNQSEPQIISDESGNAIIVWQDHRQQYEDDIYAQRINNSGNILWSVNGVPVSVPALDQSLPQLIFSENYNVIIAWEDRRSSDYDIYASMVDSSGNLTGDPVSVHDENKLPASFELYQNYPNPFNPSTKIRFSIPSVTLSEVEGSLVTLKIYDVLGNLVATLVNENKPAGKYEIEFNSNSHSGLSGIRELSSGIYFYRLQAGSFVETKKMILIR